MDIAVALVLSDISETACIFSVDSESRRDEGSKATTGEWQ